MKMYIIHFIYDDNKNHKTILTECNFKFILRKATEYWQHKKYLIQARQMGFFFAFLFYFNGNTMYIGKH
jgi:hypothetical protein